MDATVQNLIIQDATAQGVDPNLALAVAQQESGGNQNAVSSAGAIGVMQLMPSSFPGVNIYDLATNISTGVSYLRQQLSSFGDTAKALAAYNAGPGAVAQAVASGGADWLSRLPSETRSYVSSILSKVGSSVASAAGSVVSAALPSVSIGAGLVALGAAAVYFLFLD